MKERDDEIDTFQQSILDDAPAVDTPPSPDSASACRWIWFFTKLYVYFIDFLVLSWILGVGTMMKS